MLNVAAWQRSEQDQLKRFARLMAKRILIHLKHNAVVASTRQARKAGALRDRFERAYRNGHLFVKMPAWAFWQKIPVLPETLKVPLTLHPGGDVVAVTNMNGDQVVTVIVKPDDQFGAIRQRIVESDEVQSYMRDIKAQQPDAEDNFEGRLCLPEEGAVLKFQFPPIYR